MTVETFYATKRGCSALYDEQKKKYVFIEVTALVLHKVGDYVPVDWPLAKCGRISIGPVEKMDVTERDGYEAGYANKRDPNPFMILSHHYWQYAAGRARGDKERKQMDQEVVGLGAAFIY